ncbi:MAG TPA: hypothetical protein DCO86_01385 [Spirochaetaceae bacterium]|nr:hypothetical protein [Spirochaetaceae bacterium]
MKLYPEIKFRIMNGNSDELIERLGSGLINLAVITAPHDQTLLNSFKVGEEKMTAFMSLDNPLASNAKDTVDLEELAGQPLIVPSREAINDMICKWFKEIGKNPQIVCKIGNYLDVAALSGCNVGISIFPKTSYVLNPHIIAREIVNPGRLVEYPFVWLKGKPLPIADETFIEYVKSTL